MNALSINSPAEPMHRSPMNSFSESRSLCRAEQRLAYMTIGSITATFFLGCMVSAVSFYRSRKFEWAAAIISDLQSPEENPRGYLVSALATAIVGALILRLARLFHRWSRPASSQAAWTATALLALGGLGAVAIGSLAPFPHSYDTVHIPLAFGTFIALVAGLGMHLLLAALRVRASSPAWSAALLSGAAAVLGIVATLGCLYRMPHFFTGENLLRTLALWEWLLCASIVGFMLLLTRAQHDPSCGVKH